MILLVVNRPLPAAGVASGDVCSGQGQQQLRQLRQLVVGDARRQQQQQQQRVDVDTQPSYEWPWLRRRGLLRLLHNLHLTHFLPSNQPFLR